MNTEKQCPAKEIEPKQVDGERKHLEIQPVFLPLEEISCIERVIENLEITRRELQKVAEGMKPVI